MVRITLPRAGGRLKDSERAPNAKKKQKAKGTEEIKIKACWRELVVEKNGSLKTLGFSSAWKIKQRYFKSHTHTHKTTRSKHHQVCFPSVCASLLTSDVGRNEKNIVAYLLCCTRTREFSFCSSRFISSSFFFFFSFLSLTSSTAGTFNYSLKR